MDSAIPSVSTLLQQLSGIELRGESRTVAAVAILTDLEEAIAAGGSSEIEGCVRDVATAVSAIVSQGPPQAVVTSLSQCIEATVRSCGTAGPCVEQLLETIRHEQHKKESVVAAALVVVTTVVHAYAHQQRASSNLVSVLVSMLPQPAKYKDAPTRQLSMNLIAAAVRRGKQLGPEEARYLVRAVEVRDPSVRLAALSGMAQAVRCVPKCDRDASMLMLNTVARISEESTTVHLRVMAGDAMAAVLGSALQCRVFVDGGVATPSKQPQQQLSGPTSAVAGVLFWVRNVFHKYTTRAPRDTLTRGVTKFLAHSVGKTPRVGEVSRHVLEIARGHKPGDSPQNRHYTAICVSTMLEGWLGGCRSDLMRLAVLRILMQHLRGTPGGANDDLVQLAALDATRRVVGQLSEIGEDSASTLMEHVVACARRSNPPEVLYACAACYARLAVEVVLVPRSGSPHHSVAPLTLLTAAMDTIRRDKSGTAYADTVLAVAGIEYSLRNNSTTVAGIPQLARLLADFMPTSAALDHVTNPSLRMLRITAYHVAARLCFTGNSTTSSPVSIGLEGLFAASIAHLKLLIGGPYDSDTLLALNGVLATVIRVLHCDLPFDRDDLGTVRTMCEKLVPLGTGRARLPANSGATVDAAAAVRSAALRCLVALRARVEPDGVVTTQALADFLRLTTLGHPVVWDPAFLWGLLSDVVPSDTVGYTTEGRDIKNGTRVPVSAQEALDYSLDPSTAIVGVDAHLSATVDLLAYLVSQGEASSRQAVLQKLLAQLSDVTRKVAASFADCVTWNFVSIILRALQQSHVGWVLPNNEPTEAATSMSHLVTNVLRGNCPELRMLAAKAFGYLCKAAVFNAEYLTSLTTVSMDKPPVVRAGVAAALAAAHTVGGNSLSEALPFTMSFLTAVVRVESDAPCIPPLSHPASEEYITALASLMIIIGHSSSNSAASQPPPEGLEAGAVLTSVVDVLVRERTQQATGVSSSHQAPLGLTFVGLDPRVLCAYATMTRSLFMLQPTLAGDPRAVGMLLLLVSECLGPAQDHPHVLTGGFRLFELAVQLDIADVCDSSRVRARCIERIEQVLRGVVDGPEGEAAAACLNAIHRRDAGSGTTIRYEAVFDLVDGARDTATRQQLVEALQAMTTAHGSQAPDVAAVVKKLSAVLSLRPTYAVEDDGEDVGPSTRTREEEEDDVLPEDRMQSRGIAGSRRSGGEAHKRRHDDLVGLAGENASKAAAMACMDAVVGYVIANPTVVPDSEGPEPSAIDHMFQFLMSAYGMRETMGSDMRHCGSSLSRLLKAFGSSARGKGPVQRCSTQLVSCIRSAIENDDAHLPAILVAAATATHFLDAQILGKIFSAVRELSQRSVIQLPTATALALFFPPAYLGEWPSCTTVLPTVLDEALWRPWAQVLEIADEVISAASTTRTSESNNSGVQLTRTGSLRVIRDMVAVVKATVLAAPPALISKRIPNLARIITKLYAAAVEHDQLSQEQSYFMDRDVGAANDGDNDLLTLCVEPLVADPAFCRWWGTSDAEVLAPLVLKAAVQEGGVRLAALEGILRCVAGAVSAEDGTIKWAAARSLIRFVAGCVEASVGTPHSDQMTFGCAKLAAEVLLRLPHGGASAAENREGVNEQKTDAHAARRTFLAHTGRTLLHCCMSSCDMLFQPDSFSCLLRCCRALGNSCPADVARELHELRREVQTPDARVVTLLLVALEEYVESDSALGFDTAASADQLPTISIQPYSVEPLTRFVAFFFRGSETPAASYPMAARFLQGTLLPHLVQYTLNKSLIAPQAGSGGSSVIAVVTLFAVQTSKKDADNSSVNDLVEVLVALLLTSVNSEVAQPRLRQLAEDEQLAVVLRDILRAQDRNIMFHVKNILQASATPASSAAPSTTTENAAAAHRRKEENIQQHNIQQQQQQQPAVQRLRISASGFS